MRMHIALRSTVGLALVLMIGLLALAACGAGASGDGAVTPVAVAGDPTQGEALFLSKGCNACHLTTDQKLVGPGLKGVMDGKGPYGNNLPNGKPINDANVQEWIKVGGVGKIGQMPGFSDLSTDQLADLAAYLRTLK